MSKESYCLRRDVILHQIQTPDGQMDSKEFAREQSEESEYWSWTKICVVAIWIYAYFQKWIGLSALNVFVKIF